MKRNNKGITLVSLVVTIVVLIILAGAVVAAIVGNNGLINRAHKTAESWKNSSEQDEEDLQEIYSSLKIASDGEVTIDYTTLTSLVKQIVDTSVEEKQLVSQAELDNTVSTNVLDKIYPVGSIFLSVSYTNPGTYLGGSWEAYGQGKTLVGVNTSDSDFNTVEKTGGTKSESYTPAGTNNGGAVSNTTLSLNQIPNFKFRIPHVASYDSMAISGVTETRTGAEKEGSIQSVSNSGWHNISVGGGQAHNHGFTQPTFTGTSATISHVQPYITCYMWKRVE